MRAKRLWGWMVVIACVGLSGCSGARLHSDARQQQGEALRTAWKQAGVADGVATARSNLGALQREELATIDRWRTARTAAAIRSMATGGTVQVELFDKIDAALVALAGSVPDAARYRDAAVQEQLARSAVALAQGGLTAAGIEAPDCAGLTDPEIAQALAEAGAEDGRIAGYAAALKESCATPALHQTLALVGGMPPTSALRKAYDERRRLEARDSTVRLQTQAARIAYESALARYDRAREAIDHDAQALERARQALQRLQTAFDKLSAKTDKYSLGFLSEQRREAIDRFFGNVLESEPGKQPSDEGGAALLRIVLSSDFRDAQAAYANGALPTLLPLLMRRDTEKAAADTLAADLALSVRERALADERVVLVQQQVIALLDARRAAQHPGVSRVLRQPLRAVLTVPATAAQPADADTRVTVLEAAGLYLDAQYRAGSERRKREYEANYAYRARALLYAEGNLAQWNVLIGSSIDQLAAYGSSGIQPQTLIQLINAASLLWIGKGVN